MGAHFSSICLKFRWPFFKDRNRKKITFLRLSLFPLRARNGREEEKRREEKRREEKRREEKRREEKRREGKGREGKRRGEEEKRRRGEEKKRRREEEKKRRREEEKKRRREDDFWLRSLDVLIRFLVTLNPNRTVAGLGEAHWILYTNLCLGHPLALLGHHAVRNMPHSQLYNVDALLSHNCCLEPCWFRQ